MSEIKHSDRDDIAKRDFEQSQEEKREAQRLREPMPSSLPRNEKTCFINGNGHFQYELPDDCKQVIAVSYKIDEYTDFMLNDEDYSVNNRILYLVEHRPQPGEKLHITYK